MSDSLVRLDLGGLRLRLWMRLSIFFKDDPNEHGQNPLPFLKMFVLKKISIFTDGPLNG